MGKTTMEFNNMNTIAQKTNTMNKLTFLVRGSLKYVKQWG